MKDKTASSTAEAFERNIIYTTGPPSILTHDQGTEFKGEFARLEETTGVKVIKSSAYHPEGNGKAEAGVKKLKGQLLMFMDNVISVDEDWDQMPLLKAVHSINTTVTTLHGITPLEVVLGRPVNEISVLLAKRQAGHKHLLIEPDLQVQNAKDTSSRESVSSTSIR